MDWSRLPDIGAVALLTCAFVSVDRRGQTSESGIWLVGWLMVVFHFVAEFFQNFQGPAGDIASFVSLCALAWAGALFTWATIPYREKLSSRWMLGFVMAANAFYLSVAVFAPQSTSALTVAAALFGLLPLSITAAAVRTFKFGRRWALVGLYCALSAFLLLVQNRPGNGPDLAINAIFFTIYFICSVNFCLSYWRPTTVHSSPSPASSPGPWYSSSVRFRWRTSPPFIWKAKSGTCRNTSSRSA